MFQICGNNPLSIETYCKPLGKNTSQYTETIWWIDISSLAFSIAIPIDVTEPLTQPAYAALGRGIAEKYASLGVKLVLNYSSCKKSAEETTKLIEQYGIEFITLKADVSNTTAIEKLFTNAINHFGKLDIVVANAGIELIKTPAIGSPEKDFDKIFNLNVKETFFCASAGCKVCGGWWQNYSRFLYHEYPF